MSVGFVRFFRRTGPDRNRFAVGIMTVVVQMRIDREFVRHMWAEQGDELGMACDRLGMAGAAHVPVEAHHGIRRGHDQCRSWETSSTPQPYRSRIVAIKW